MCSSRLETFHSSNRAEAEEANFGHELEEAIDLKNVLHIGNSLFESVDDVYAD